MKKRLVRSAALLVFCAVVALGQKPDWKEYEYVDDGFGISAPFKPRLEKDLVDTDAGKLELHTYSVSAGPLWHLAVSVTDVSKFGDLPAKDLLQAAKNGSVAEVKGKLVAERDTVHDGAPGIEYEINGANEHSLIRCYYVNGKTITVMSTAGINFPLFPDTDRFFDSLHFIPAWKDYAYPDDGFVVSAPYKPSLENKSVATKAGPVDMHIYTIDLGGGTGLMISVADYGKGNKLRTEALQLTKNASLESLKAKLLTEKDISLGANPGIEFEMRTDDYRARSRYYIVSSKLLTLVSYAGDGKLLPPDTSRILDSLRLLDSQGSK